MMITVFCLDEEGGMALNHRRQSSDLRQRVHLSRRLGERTLGITSYSEKKLREDGSRLWAFPGEETSVVVPKVQIVSDLSSANTDAVWPEVERPSLSEELWVYRWNRLYPSDVRMDPDFLKGYRLLAEEDFAGTSHERITFSIYRREDVQ